MRHIDADTLALLALGEIVADGDGRAHLDECPACDAELANLTRAVSVGRSTLDAVDLVAPAPRVWSRITDELGIEQATPDAPVAPVTELATRRRWITVAAVAASFAVLAAGGIAIWNAARPSDATVVATATLDAFPAWPDATGGAAVEERPDGSRVVQLTIDAEPAGDDYLEAWLISSDATRLVSLGTVEGNSGTFSVPAGVDLSVYDQVDVSAEPYDGDPAHSGDSIVRGQLR